VLDDVDPATAVVLARAFTAYFQLVNTTEQLHRWQELTTGTEGPLAATIGRIGAALESGDLSRELLESVLERLEYRPVFTAHPTEASGRSVLRLLRKIAETVQVAEDPRRPVAQVPADERRLAELVGLLWQTDELRVVKPEPTDEARTAVYYLRSIAGEVVPELLAELDRQLARIDVTLPAGARPLRFGTWAGGDRDGNPNVTPAVTLEVLHLQHSSGLGESIAADAEALPITWESVRRLNADEPYRLKLSFVRVRLSRTRDRLVGGTPHEPGRDYLGFDDLVRDLTLVRDSMLAAGDQLTGDGAILRLIRTAVTFGAGRRGRPRAQREAPCRPRRAVRPHRRARLRLARASRPHRGAVTRDGVGTSAHRCRRQRAGGGGDSVAGPARRDPRGAGRLRTGGHRDLHRVDDPRRRRPVRGRGAGARGRARRPGRHAVRS
jgi:phosphoenolpyruvate carboxylase